MSPENLTNVYNNNPTLQGQYSLQQYLELFGQGGTTQPDPDPDPDPTPDPDPDPTTPPIQNAGGGGGGIQGLQLTYTPGAQPRLNKSTFNESYDQLDDMGITRKDPNFLQRGITGVKDFLGKFNSGPKVRGTLGDRRQAAYDGGQKLPSIFAAIGRMQSPFNPDSRNYNRDMATQLNYLEGTDGTKLTGKKDPYTGETIFTETSAGMIGRDPQSGLMKYGPGTVLEGKNVFSGFGSNNLVSALDRYIDKMKRRGTKDGIYDEKNLTPYQLEKLKKANIEKQSYFDSSFKKEQEKQRQIEEEKIREEKAKQDAINRAGQIAAQKGADVGVSGGGRGSRRGDADISESSRAAAAKGNYATDDTAGFFARGGRVKSYFDGGIASFKNGGRINFKGGGMDASKSDFKSTNTNSPGHPSNKTTNPSTNKATSGGGGGGGGNNNPPPKDNTPPPKKPKPKVKKNISTGSFFPTFNFLKKFRAHDKYTDQLKASEKPNYHEKGGLDFMARFPNLNPDIAKSLATGYQNVFEVGRALADGPGGMTVGNALNKAKEESRLNAAGIDAYANPDSSLYQNYFNQDPLTGAVPFNNQSMATGGRVNYFNGGIVSLRRR